MQSSCDGGRVTTAKVLTAARQEESVLAAARAAGAVNVERFTHGTTVATNALLERKGARTAFVTTAGFEHLLHLRRQTRAHLYRPCAAMARAARPARALPRRARAHRAGRRARAARPRLAAGHRRRRGRGLPAARVPRSGARARGRRRSCGGGCPARTSSPRTRSRRSSASTSARRRLRPTPIWARRGALPARARRRVRRTRGCPVPLVMRSSGGVATLDEAAAHPATIARLRPGRRRRRRGAACARSPASRTRSRSTWAGRRPTSA